MIRSASRDLRVPQESFVLGPAQAAALGLGAGATAAASRLVVARSSVLEPGATFPIGPVSLTIGRAAENSVALAEDGFVSALHARVETARNGVWLVDLDSTNGTYVNRERVEGRRRLGDGDIVRIGDTELRFER